ncbi:hypothetical protein QN277_005435 [Acacia crassicarpa]|uniref:PGG domain-containing protein n=1 Tax=Acacia crassicarpa TaxID=499986 RepID=A0AAE1MGE0_9FABA|nr:hypothetical protein QN277_005435 [Acacia crassicarpa]
MGKKRSEIEIEGGNMFSETMRRAHVAYRNSDWKTFKQIFEQDKTELLNHFDLFEDTPISIAIRSGNPKLLKDLLNMLSGEERWVAFTKPNCRRNTLLHNMAMRKRRLSVQMTEVILDFEKEDEAALPEEERKKRRPKLLERKNESGETPLFRAAAFGNLEMLKHVVQDHIKAEEAEGDLFKIHQYSETETILHACINAQHFDVALWIISKMNGRRLVLERNKKNLTCLELLASVPSAFRSHYPMGSLASLSYNLLPDERYQFLEGGDNSNESCGHPIDIEAGLYHDTAKPGTSVFSGIESLWKDKREHQLAKRLAEFLVRHDWTWQISYSNRTSDSQQLQLPPRLYNVEKRKHQLERKEEKEEDNDQSTVLKHYSTPLFAAASNGIEEIVDSFLKEHPVSLNYMGVEGTNILHIAVRHRQLKIFKLLKKDPWFSSLGYRISSANRTALHEVASLDYYRGSSQPGAAFELQEELKWYKRVEKEVPSHLHLHCDNRALTAKDVLEIEHHDMLEKAREWIKQTAESCSTVAVLVATVVFAAAYTIPGGSEGGTPVFLRSPVFIFFTVMDIVALAFSLSSVVMFLSILTSPFELWDFHKSLPQKLNLGFAFLFLALTTTILAFCATILLTIRLPWKNWTSTLVYSASFFPVAIFGLIEFPLYKKIPMLLHKAGKKAMKATKAIGGVVRRFKKPKNQ